MMNKLNDWFAGNQSALDLYERLVFIAHTWDDLIDRDKPVGNDAINELVCNLLLYLPGNTFYRQYEVELRALILVGIVGYLTANRIEQDLVNPDGHQIELAHYLRYAVANAAIFMMTVLNGVHKTPAILAEAMPVMIPERLANYIKEFDHAPA